MSFCLHEDNFVSLPGATPYILSLKLLRTYKPRDLSKKRSLTHPHHSQNLVQRNEICLREDKKFDRVGPQCPQDAQRDGTL